MIIIGRTEEALSHDAGANLTYDGLHKYACDAWTRPANG